MRKIVRKVTTFLAGVLLIGTLSACSKFDASGYMNAVLDNVYRNDSTGLVTMEVGTAEEAGAVYQNGIDSAVNVVLATVDVSDELKAEYRQFYEELYASVKYTVGEATELEDGTFEVPVTCEKMYVFTDAVAAYEAKVAELVAVWTEAALAGEEVPSDEAMNEEFFTVFKDCIVTELADVTYGEPETITVRVESVQDIWTPNPEDMLKLEYALVDFEELFVTE